MVDSVRNFPCFGREETADRPADRLVAFAGGVFKLSSIQYIDMAAQVINQPLFLERAGCQADTAAGNPKHLPHNVMRESHRVGGDAISRHQQPSRQSLLRIMKLVAT